MSHPNNSVEVVGNGLYPAIVERLVGAIQEAGGGATETHFLVSPEADQLWKQLGMAIVQFVIKIRAMLTLWVNYARSLEDAMQAVGLAPGHVEEGINETNFPCLPWEAGEVQRPFKLYWFNKNLDTDLAIEKMFGEGYRPATLREALAYCELNPEMQKKFSITILGSVWRNKVARLWTYKSRPQLDLYRCEWGLTDKDLLIAVQRTAPLAA